MKLIYKGMMGLILLAVLILIMVGIQNTFYKEAKDNIEVYDCITSLELSQVLTKLNLKNPPLQCKTKDVYIDEDLGNERKLKRAKFKIAEEMKDCWGKFGTGRKKLFEGEGVYCNICSVIQFSDENREDKNVIPKFTEYLSETSIPNTGIKYADYFTPTEKGEVKDLLDDPKVYNKKDEKLSAELSAEQDYAVIFSYIKGKDSITQYKENEYLSLSTKNTKVGGGVIGGLAGGAVIGVLAVFTPVGWVTLTTGLLIVAGGAIAGTVSDFFIDKDEGHLALINLIEYHPEELAKTFCQELR